MNQNDIAALKEIVGLRGWAVYQTLLKGKFDATYAKLRNSRRNDVSYGKVCGMLDGIEYSLEVVDNTINEGEDEPQPA